MRWLNERHAASSSGRTRLNSSSDARLLRATLEAASAGGPAPADAELAADADDLDVRPLFDGAELERI